MRLKIGDFLLFFGRSGKPQSTQKDGEKNKNKILPSVGFS